jgi:hypothetical protein
MSKKQLIDLLDEDKPIAEQKFACMSFISPENEIKKRELFFFENYLKHYDFLKSMEKFSQFIHFISYKYNLNVDDLTAEYASFLETEKPSLVTDLNTDYKGFVDKNERELEEAYHKENSFQTSVRGLKIRGVFPTQQEAELRCRMIREADPHHDVYVGPVGLWIPFHPDAYKTGNVQYLEKELNELMHEKKKNEDTAKSEFDKRVKQSKVNAIQANIEKAKEHNNRLTQTINEKGDLVSIQNMNTQEKNLGVNASLEDIQKELFEGEDILLEKKPGAETKTDGAAPETTA